MLMNCVVLGGIDEDAAPFIPGSLHTALSNLRNFAQVYWGRYEDDVKMNRMALLLLKHGANLHFQYKTDEDEP